MKKIQPKASNWESVPAMVPVLVIIVFSFLLYSNTLRHSYALDDDIVSRNNILVQQGFGGIPNLFTHGFFYGFNGNNEQAYRPVPLITLAVETGLWGESPEIHHLFNVLYYSLSCGLLFLLFRRLFRGYSLIIPFLMTLLFVAHPVHTECVANFKSRDEVLNLFFLILLLWFLIRFADTGKKSMLVFSTFFFALSLLSKEQSVTFLVIIPLVLYWFSSQPVKKIVVVTLPFVILTAGYFLLRAAVLDSLTFSETISLDNNSLVAATSLADRIATAVLILGKYMLVLFFPHPLSFDYSFDQIPITGFADPAVLGIVFFLIAAGILSVLYLRRKNVLVFSFLFFFITLSMVSNIVFLIGTSMGERFLLIPSLAFCMAIVWAVSVNVKRMNRIAGKNGERLIYTFILIIAGIFTVLTVSRNRDWKDNLTLYSAGVKAAPRSYRTHSMLAYELSLRAKAEQSAAEQRRLIASSEYHYLLSLRIYPQSVSALYNYAILKLETGFPAAAIGLFARATAADPLDYNSWNNLAVVSFQEGRIDSALRYFLKLDQLRPNDPAIVDAIGVTYARRNEFDRAVGYFEKALSIDPSRMNTYDKLIELLVNRGDTARARYYRTMAMMNGR